MPGVLDLSIVASEPETKAPTTRSLNRLMSEWVEVVQGNYQLTQKAIETVKMQIHESKIEKKTQEIAGKEILTTNDKFKRPTKLT